MSNNDNDTTTTTKMRAMFIHNDGRKDAAELTSIDQPEPKKNEVRIRVVNAAIDTATPSMIRNDFDSRLVHSKKKPIVIGWHYSGTIDMIGEDVTDLKVGEHVFGFLDYVPEQQQGSYAEFITIPSDKTAIKPESIPFDIAAAAGTEALTALQAIRDVGGLSASGQKVLVIGGGGGVGSAAVQIAKILGAHVTAVCSTKDVERVQSYGADIIIDRKKTPDFFKSKEYDNSFHVIFDTPGSSSWLESQRSLIKGGRYVVPIFRWFFLRDWFLSLFTSTRPKDVWTEPKRSDLAALGQWLEDQRIKIEIDSKHKIRDLNAAIARQNESKVGRVVVEVEGGWE